MALQIRKATIRDTDDILQLENACFTYDQMSRRSIQSFIKKASADLFVAHVNHTIVGSLTVLYRKNSKKARLYSIAVLPSHRNIGIAAALCDTMNRAVLQKKLSAIILEVKIDNLHAIQFYKKYGYQAFGKYIKYYDDGSDALRMIKTLT